MVFFYIDIDLMVVKSKSFDFVTDLQQLIREMDELFQDGWYEDEEEAYIALDKIIKDSK